MQSIVLEVKDNGEIVRAISSLNSYIIYQSGPLVVSLL